MNFISVLRRSRTCKKFVRFSPRSRKVRISLSKALVSKYFFVNLPSLLFTVFGLIWLNCIRTRFSCTNFVRSVIKELVHASSCANVELLTHLRSLESTKEARVAVSFPWISSVYYAGLAHARNSYGFHREAGKLEFLWVKLWFRNISLSICLPFYSRFLG